MEFTLVMLPFLGFMFLILNVAWSIYSRATLQYAVAQGVRYAVTSQTLPGLGQKDSIKTVVQRSAFGRLGAGRGATQFANIQVHFFLPDGTAVATGAPPTTGVYPLVEVSVESISTKNLMPLVKMPGLTAMNAIMMSARAWDRMEAPPMTGPPTP